MFFAFFERGFGHIRSYSFNIFTLSFSRTQFPDSPYALDHSLISGEGTQQWRLVSGSSSRASMHRTYLFPFCFKLQLFRKFVLYLSLLVFLVLFSLRLDSRTQISYIFVFLPLWTCHLAVFIGAIVGILSFCIRPPNRYLFDITR